MPNGFGRGRGYGRGFGGGMGFGFRGSSPPWPYVGIGRGGLPRGGYFFGGATGAPVAQPYQQFSYPANPGFGAGQTSYPFSAGMPTAPGYAPFSPQMSREEELDYLRNQAEAISEQLEQIETRMRDLANNE